MTSEAKARTHDVLLEMQATLRIVASAGTLDRIWAFRYTHCRDLLLDSELRSALPGFLHQCISIDNFHNFIRLYHPEISQRHHYIDDMLGRCRTSRIEHKLVREASVRIDKVRVELMAPPCPTGDDAGGKAGRTRDGTGAAA